MDQWLANCVWPGYYQDKCTHNINAYYSHNQIKCIYQLEIKHFCATHIKIKAGISIPATLYLLDKISKVSIFSRGRLHIIQMAPKTYVLLMLYVMHQVTRPHLIETKHQYMTGSVISWTTGTDYYRIAIAAIQQPKVFIQKEQTVIIKAVAYQPTTPGLFGFESKTQMINLDSSRDIMNTPITNW